MYHKPVVITKRIITITNGSYIKTNFFRKNFEDKEMAFKNGLIDMQAMAYNEGQMLFQH